MDGHGGEGAGGSANGGSTNGGSVGDTLARKHSWALPLPRPNRPGVTVLVWGRNDLGQLGLGAATAAAAGGGGGEGAAPAPPSAVYVPTPVEALSGRDVVELAGGSFHSAFVTADGELFTSGCNDNSQLGRRVGEGGSSIGNGISSGGGGGGSSGGVGDGRPGAVRALEAHTVAAAGCGASHSMALTEQGGVLAWGGNEFGQTGTGMEGSDLAHPRPVRGVGAGEHHRVVRLAVGANHALLLTGGGGVLAVGQGSFGALGLGPEALENRPVPLPVAPLAALGVVQVAAGENHSVALTADGRVFAWGRGKYGALGHGDWGNRAAPAEVAALRGRHATQVACGGDHTLVLTAPPPPPPAASNQSAWTWAALPLPAAAAAAAAAAPGAAGGAGFAAAPADGQNSSQQQQQLQGEGAGAGAGSGGGGSGGGGGVLYAFGRGTWGATGLGATDNTCRPCRVRGALAAEGLAVAQVSAGARHSLVLTACGAVFAFGNNDFGQLGTGGPISNASSAAMEDDGSGAGAGDGGGGDDGGSSVAVCCSPRRVELLPAGVRPLAVVAAGDCSMVLAQEASAATACNSPRNRQRHGQYGLPYSIPDLQLLAAAATAASENGSSGGSSGGAGGGGAGGRELRELVVGVEEVLGCPGYVLSLFSTETNRRRRRTVSDGSQRDASPERGGVTAAAAAAAAKRRKQEGGNGVAAHDYDLLQPQRGQPQQQQQEQHDHDQQQHQQQHELEQQAQKLQKQQQGPDQEEHQEQEEEAAGHGLDVDAVQGCFAALLRLYRPEVVAALSSGLHRLLDAAVAVAAAAVAAGGGAGAGAAVAGAGGGGGTGGGSGVGSGGGPEAAAAAAAAAAGSEVLLLRVLFVAYQCPLLASSGVGGSLATRLVDITTRLLPHEAQQRLCGWLAALPPELFGGRVVRPLQTHLAEAAQRAAEAAAVAAAAAAHGHGHMWLAGGGGGGEPPQKRQVAAARAELLAAARVMAGLYEANEQAGEKLPYTEFHNAALSGCVNLKDEYLIWLRAGGGRSMSGPGGWSLSSHGSSSAGGSNGGGGGGGGGRPRRPGAWALSPHTPLSSLCQTPFLLTPDAKSRILQGEALIQKEAEMNASAQAALMQGIHPAHAVFLEVSVRRAHILHDAAQQLAGRPLHQLKRPLRVSFVSQGMAEEGVDQGGVSREFFQLLVAEIFQPQYGLFTYSEETRTFWFNTAMAALEADGEGGGGGGLGADASGLAEYRLVGLVLGLAIYNGVILDVHLPQVVYKKLLGEGPLGLADLAEAFPALGRSLAAVMAMEPEDVEDTLCRNFEVETEVFGSRRAVPLIPGGQHVPVTGANVGRYVARLCEWTLGEAVEAQFRAFATGFHQVCGGPALSLFRHEELELLICGLPHLDFGALEANARYEGGYGADHPTVRMFWQVLSGLDLDQKRRFLAFTTGCDRAPVAGLGALVLTIQRSGPDSERLPSAHTCFNVLMLPDYSTRSKLKTKLLTAIENAQGFGLK